MILRPWTSRRANVSASRRRGQRFASRVQRLRARRGIETSARKSGRPRPASSLKSTRATNGTSHSDRGDAIRASLPEGGVCRAPPGRPGRQGLGLGFFDPGPPASLASRIADAMTDDELLGQVFFLGWQGVGPSAEIQHWIKDREHRRSEDLPAQRLGPHLACAGRGSDAAPGCSAAGSHVPLFVATDQEGGWVRQIKDETSISPGNLALGAAGAPGDCLPAPGTTSAGSSRRWASTWTSRPPRTSTPTPRRA